MAIAVRYGYFTPLLSFLCIILSPATSPANITETAYFKTALEAHRDDVSQFQAVAQAALTKIELSLSGGGRPTAAHVDEFIKRVSLECQGTAAPIDCRLRLTRLQAAISEQDDGLSQYLLQWIGDLMIEWDHSRIFHPEDARRYSEFLPKPYPYPNVAGIAAYFPSDTDTILDGSLAYVRNVSSRHPVYRVAAATTPAANFDSSSLRQAIRDFLLYCSIIESIFELFDDQDTTGEVDDDESGRITADAAVTDTGERRAIEFLRRLVNLLSHVPVIKTETDALPAAPLSIAPRDIRKLPARLKDNSPLTSEIRPIYDVLDLIKSGIRPSSALARLSHKAADLPCRWTHVLGVLAREWDSAATSLAGFDRTSIFDYGDAGDDPLFFSQLSTLFASSCPGLLQDDSNRDLPDLVTRTFDLMSAMQAHIGSSTGTSPVHAAPIPEVLRLTVELLDDVRPLILGAIDADNRIHDRRLAQWMEIYVLAAEQRYKETVSGTLCYLFGLAQEADGTATDPGSACDQEFSTTIANRVAALAAEEVESGNGADQFLALVHGYITACIEAQLEDATDD